VKDWEIGMHGGLLVTTPTTAETTILSTVLIQSSDLWRLVCDKTNKGVVVKHCFKDCSDLVPLFAERNAN
jgi:hypothetical protein